MASDFVYIKLELASSYLPKDNWKVVLLGKGDYETEKLKLSYPTQVVDLIPFSRSAIIKSLLAQCVRKSLVITDQSFGFKHEQIWSLKKNAKNGAE